MEIFKKILRKVLTKPVWLIERAWARWTFPSPLSLPPLKVSQGSTPLFILTTPRSINQGLWSVYSLVKNLSEDFCAILIVDGPLPSRDLREKIEKLLPGLKLLTAREIISPLQARAPHLFASALVYPTQRKLALLTVLNETQSLVYSDDDVLAFAPLAEINQWARSSKKEVAFYVQEATGSTNFDPEFRRIAEAQGLQAAPTLNTGFMALPKGTLKIEVAEALLANALPYTWFTETTIIAFQLFAGVGLPMGDYKVSCQRQFFFEPDVDYTKIKLRHFVGPVRHLMCLRGISALQRDRCRT